MPRRLLVPQDDLSLPGLAKLGNVIAIIHSYQLYAVERWIVDRAALLRLLVVYTGDPAHSVHLHVYESDDDRALELLAAQSGAKPKHTSEGVLMLTSLARFRSDHTIVLIPDGLFSQPIKSRLYANINLLRLGSSARTALTLSEPSETTNERFLRTYHTKPTRVLALVALVQSALSLFGYPLPTDGLLCDTTLHAITHWADLFGCPSDRTVDPSFIAALLSLVLATRNKLAHLGYSHLLPPDPFVQPLSPALAAYSQSPAPFIPLTNHLLNSVSASFDSKRLSRVIRTKLNSDTTDTLLSPVPSLPAFIAIVSSSPDVAPDSLTAIWSSSTPPIHRKRHNQNRGGVASDGDNARRTKKYDGRSTEEESDPVHRFGGSFHWPPRRVKLRSWAGLTKRKHQSVDLTPSLRTDLPPLPPKSTQTERFRDRDRPLPALPVSKPPSANTQQRRSASRRSTIGPVGLVVPTTTGSSASASIFSFSNAGPQSPTLPPLQTSFFGEGDDDDLLSSGQVSPLSDTQTRPNPFYFSLGGSQAPTPGAAQHTHSHLYPIPSFRSSSIPPIIGDGQASNNNNVLSAHTATAVTRNQNLNIDEKMLARLLLDKGKGRKRRDSDDTSGSGGGGRIASWAGPVSVGVGGWADEDEEEEEGSEIRTVGLSSTSLSVAKSKSTSASAGLVPPKDWGKQGKDKERARFDSLVRVVDKEGRLVEEEMDSDDEDDEESEDGSGSEYARGRVRERRSGEKVRVEEDDWDGDGDSEKVEEEEEERRETGRWRAARGVAKGEVRSDRRRSFHDLDTFRELQVLSPERMKIDVELCGQCLIMWRRERHLRNVVDCVRLLTSTLSKSNTLLQSNYQSHQATLTALASLSATPNYASVYPSTTNVAVTSSNPSSTASRSPSPKPQRPSPFSSPPPTFSSSPPPFSPLPDHKQSPTHLLQSIDEASHQTDRFSQATNTLLYQSEQFDVQGLWSSVGRERRKVWALRGGVFGEGNGGGGNNGDNSAVGESGAEGGQEPEPGRKLPEGVHGAHGSFNRLQWRLDGRGMLVDDLGRTESEAEEEERVERGGADEGAREVGVEQGEAAGSSPRPELLPAVHDRQVDERQRDTAQPKPESGHAQREDEEVELEFLDRYLGIKPMWLLRFFTSWGAKWSAVDANASAATGGTSEAPDADAGESTNGKTAVVAVGRDFDSREDNEPTVEGSDATLSTGGSGGKKGDLPRPDVSPSGDDE